MGGREEGEARMKNSGRSPTRAAAAGGRARGLEVGDGASKRRQPCSKGAQLCDAAIHGQVTELKKLVAYGYDLSEQHERGTAMHCECSRESSRGVSQVLRYYRLLGL